ncbi:hypothetical protein ACFL1X_00550 [Candidatus Hydrogenedentota bacterium]
MLGLAMLISSVIIMIKVADAENRSGLFWGLVTLVVCLACGWFIRLPLVNICIGLFISYMAMFAMKLIQGNQ